MRNITTRKEMVVVKDSDRIIMVQYDMKGSVDGINYAQGTTCDNVNYFPNSQWNDADEDLTKMYKIAEGYIKGDTVIEKVDAFICMAHQLETEGFLEDKSEPGLHKEVIPTEQVEIIQEALSLYGQSMDILYDGGVEDENMNYKRFDVITLKGMLKSKVVIELTTEEKDGFTSRNGVDFPEYI